MEGGCRAEKAGTHLGGGDTAAVLLAVAGLVGVAGASWAVCGMAFPAGALPAVPAVVCVARASGVDVAGQGVEEAG
jgi:hypothetical protein